MTLRALLEEAVSNIIAIQKDINEIKLPKIEYETSQKQEAILLSMSHMEAEMQNLEIQNVDSPENPFNKN